MNPSLRKQVEALLKRADGAQPAQAEALLRQALQMAPGQAWAAAGAASVLARRGNLQAAATLLQQAARAEPGNAEHYVALGEVYRAGGAEEAAMAAWREALRLAPNDAMAHGHMGRAMQRRELPEEAARHFRRQAELLPDRPGPQLELAVVLQQVGDWDGALAAFDRALELDPKCEGALAGKSGMLFRKGDVAGAMALVQPLVDAGSLDPDVALAYASVAARAGRAAEACTHVERVAVDQRVPREVRRLLHHRLGDLYERQGRHDEAFRHFCEGNLLLQARFDMADHLRWVDDIIAAFSPQAMARLPRAANADRLPVFIVGMPRSGTSLTEQILASHPQVHGAGELADIENIAKRLGRELKVPRGFPACVADVDRITLGKLADAHLERLRRMAPGKSRVTDKMPQNFWYLGLIRLLFPEARIIHCVRDPVDTCLSCFQQSFSSAHAYSANLATLGGYYVQYRRMMAHWEAVGIPMYTARYEDLVADQERVSRELVEHVGLRWDDACLRPHELRRDVLTASIEQVKRPVYGSSVGRWRAYEKHLGPLLAALAEGGVEI